jgi:hypothetical protein
MRRSALPCTNRSAAWLSDLITATEAVAASEAPCDPAILNAFNHRLAMQAEVRALFEPATPGKGHQQEPARVGPR